VYVIGCDVGSQSLKGVLVDADGTVCAQASAAYPVAYPHPGWAQQDPGDWRRALASVVRELLATGGAAPTDVVALGLASQVDGLVAIDGEGDPLAPAIIWLDRRATEQTRSMGRAVDAAEVRRRTGLNLDASHVAPKLLWLRDHHPDIVQRAAGLLLPGSALLAWLTGARLVDHANASSTLLYDLTTRAWSPELLDAVGIDPAVLGTIAAGADVAGPLRRAAAETLGLTERTHVVVGTGDEHAACLGAGAVRPGTVVDITGTAEPVASAALTPILDHEGLVETHAHADPRAWLVENPGFVSGGSVSWFRSTLADGRPVAALDEEAATGSRPGSDGVTFLPTLSGATAPRWNDDARGVFAGLSLNHDRAHLYRAVLEGCTFALRDIVDRLDAIGLGSDELRVVGGGARSPFWLQMKADVTGRPVRTLASDEATAVGAALLAMVGGGLAPDLDAAIACAVHVRPERHEPDPAARAAYEDAYGRYRALFDAVEPTWSSRRPA
jgi:xylulokinase